MWDGGFALSAGRHPVKCNTHHTFSLYTTTSLFVSATLFPLYAAIDLTLSRRKFINAAFSVAQITYPTRVSTSRWKITRYKLLTLTASFISLPLTG
ncbi:hypothetical protein DNJ04_07120 [Salmonella enterica subsp. enterica serovar Kirkee]|nr:hypothetical protein [Salmonella enterica subsp. enterica serovar Kirkee]EBV0168116.1 hypothetical protein [Salmonella enterica subsp. enterica serovar Kirkee]EDS7315637.1 hypothetical protein [Salmonella enterica subsp. enterica]EDV0352483.1 hypothetical protein [Salmonella enterica subsp. enterica serovar Kirkee]